ncbi:zinc finger, CCHC-type containing protein [Tanacetum coccineum]|uniref:Zinc finger, CCHC-type containing protein n=1 Tax=Tanacetum coccineum TaxID=301880 RepID=A0ABQ5B9B7_9ASTR
MSPTKSLLDVGSRRISIFIVGTFVSLGCSGNTMRIMRRTLKILLVITYEYTISVEGDIGDGVSMKPSGHILLIIVFVVGDGLLFDNIGRTHTVDNGVQDEDVGETITRDGEGSEDWDSGDVGIGIGSITIWEDLTTRFLAQFFPPGRTTKPRNDILMFQQHHGESLLEAWTHFKDLLQKVPHHGIDLCLKVQFFYDHVNPVTRRTIDQSVSGKLRDRNAKESWALLEYLALYDNKIE